MNADQGATVITMLLESNRTAEVEVLIGGTTNAAYRTVSLDRAIDINGGESDIRMASILLHVKRQRKSKGPKTMTIQKQLRHGAAGSSEEKYMLLLFFRTFTMDDKVFCVLVRNNNVGLTSLYYWQSFKLGGGAYISNPVWLGTWNEMNVFSSDCIFPTKIESTVESRFPDKGLATHERFHSFRFKVSKIVVRQVFFRDVCKSASCDGRYGTECHCFGGSGTPTIKKLFGVQISADCFAGLDVKPFYSHALANLLLPSAMIYGDVPPDYAKIKLHVKTELERHDGYLLTVWSKPARTQKDDVATFSKIHITALQPTGQPLTQLILN